jgi:transcriptional regulator with XRE-family HTH domain
MARTAFKDALGKLVVKLRSEAGLSQERLALEAEVDRTRLGEIERGEANPTIDTLDKIAQTLHQTLGSLILQAEELSSGTARVPAPTINPAYLDHTVPLPKGLTHEQLAVALNRALALLDQIGLNPEMGDIQANIYSGAVSNIVTKAIAEASDFVQNKDTTHPDLYNPVLPKSDPDWGLEMKATNQVGKGGESHNPGQGWFMVVVYKVINDQTHFVQVEVAELAYDDWTIHERAETSNRTRTAVTKVAATRRLRENSVYLDPAHVPSRIRQIKEARGRAYLF